MYAYWLCGADLLEFSSLHSLLSVLPESTCRSQQWLEPRCRSTCLVYETPTTCWLAAVVQSCALLLSTLRLLLCPCWLHGNERICWSTASTSCGEFETQWPLCMFASLPCFIVDFGPWWKERNDPSKTGAIKCDWLRWVDSHVMNRSKQALEQKFRDGGVQISTPLNCQTVELEFRSQKIGTPGLCCQAMLTNCCRVM